MAIVSLVRRAARQGELIDRWWRENRPAAPDLFASELAAALESLAAAPGLGRRAEDVGFPGVRRILLRTT